MKLANLGRIFGLFIVLAGLAGCELPSQIAWSPDGKQAAWRRDTRLWLIDADGNIVKAFERPTLGGMAWSADSRTLYLAGEREDNDPPAEFEVRNNWLSVPRNNGQPATQSSSLPAGETNQQMGVYAYRDGQLAPLFHIDADTIAHMQLSPDERWLAVVAWQDKPNHFELYVYSMGSKHVYSLAAPITLGICFTGPARLAFVEPDRPGEKLEHQTGRLVEVTLDDASDTLERTPLLSVLPDRTLWLAALGENILFTSQAQAFPGKSTEDATLTLYFYSRADSAVTAIAQDVGPLFAPSPDGKRILFEKVTPAIEEKPEKSELAVMNSNGSDGHALRDISTIGKPMWPAWRTSDEFTFVGPDDSAKAGKVEDNKRLMLLDVVQYRLPSNGQSLEPLNTLSTSWDDEMKPYYKVPATQPTPTP